jgi:hypothetical protein
VEEFFYANSIIHLLFGKIEMIYFIQEEISKDTKIGYTNQTIKKRLKTLQSGNSKKLICIGIVDGNKETEDKIHRLFKHFHIRGEWFRYDSTILDFISLNGGKIYKKSEEEERRERLEERWNKVCF